MLRFSPLALWLAFTAAGWSSQQGSTEVDLGAGVADYSYVQTCGGQRRVVASPVYAQVRRVQPSGFIWAGELSAAPGKVQGPGSGTDAHDEMCSRECVGDRVASGQISLRIGWEGRNIRGEVGPSAVFHPDLGWFPAPSVVVQFGDPSVIYGQTSLLAGPFTGNLEIDVLQLGLGRRWDSGEIFASTSPLVLTGEMPVSLRLMGLVQVQEGMAVGLDLGASAPYDGYHPGLRAMLVLRLDPATL